MSIVMCGPKCTIEDKNGRNGCGDRIESHIGAVISMWEENGYDDSDFVALVWDAESMSCKKITYASTRGWTYHNGANIDASAGVRAAARESYIDTVRALTAADLISDAKKISIGDIVRSTTTRGKNVGIEGMVRLIGTDSYKSTRYIPRYRYSVEVAGESCRRWISDASVEKVGAVIPSTEEINRVADEWLARASFYRLSKVGG